jgi:hypothetical protein
VRLGPETRNQTRYDRSRRTSSPFSLRDWCNYMTLEHRLQSDASIISREIVNLTLQGGASAREYAHG